MRSFLPKLIYPAVFLLVISLTYLALNFIFTRKTEPEPIFLKVVGFWEPEVFNAVKSDFQKKNPSVTIEYEQRPKENYLANLQADLNQTNTGPDLFWWHSGWGPQLAKNLAELPENTMSNEEFAETFYPIAQTDMKLGSTYRGFPLEIDGLALLYNKTIFASTNFKEPPTTWDGLRSTYGQSLTTRDKQRILNSAIALGSVNNVENFSEILGLFLLQNDVVFTKNRQLNILENEGSQANNLAADSIEGYLKFSKQDKVWDNTLPNSLEAFASGKTAMVILPSEKIHKLLDFVKKENLKLDFGVAPVPQLPNAEPVTWGSYWALGVSENSAQKQAAWELAKFSTSPEMLRLVFKLEAESNTFGRAYPRVEMAREQTTNPYLAAYLAQAKTAKSWYLHSDTKDEGLNDKLVAEFKAVTTEMEKGRSASGSLKDLAEKINPILRQYQIIN